MRPQRLPLFFFVLFLVLGLTGVSAAQDWQGGAAFGVRVTDEHGDAIAGAQIVARVSDVEAIGPGPIETDGGGRAVISGLREGEWFVEVSHGGYMLYSAYVSLRSGKKPIVGFSSQVNTKTSWDPMTVKFQKATSNFSRTLSTTRRAEPKPPKVVREQPAPPPKVVRPEPEPPKVVRPEPEPPKVVRPEPEPEMEPVTQKADPPPAPAPVPAEQPAVPQPEPEPEMTPESAPAADLQEAIEPPATIEPEAPAPEPPAPMVEPPVETASAATPSVASSPMVDEPPVDPAPAPMEPERAPVMTEEIEAPEPEEPSATEVDTSAAEVDAPPTAPIEEPTLAASEASVAVAVQEPAPTPAPEIPQPEIPQPVVLQPETQQVEPPVTPPQPAADSTPVEPEVVESTQVEPEVVEPAQPEPIAPEAEAPPAKRAAPPAPTPPAPETPETATAPSVPGRLPRFLRSAASGSCSECETGEWAIAAEQEAARASDVTSRSECNDAYLERVSSAAQLLADEPSERLDNYAGPVLTAMFRLDGHARDQLQDLLASVTDPESNCQMAGVVLPRGASFSGYVLEAWDSLGGRACRAGLDCAVGRARWLEDPQVIEGAERVVVYGVFKNRSSRRERRLRMTIYFKPMDPAWIPRTR